MQKTGITGKISKNKFPLLNLGLTKSTSINVGVPFMNKLRSAVEHRPARADKLFKEELYRVPHCFSVDCTDEMYHDSNSSIQERLPSFHQPITSETCRNVIIVEASPILCKFSNVSADNFYEFVVVFYSYIICLNKGFDRLDVVFDRYCKNSLKVQTRKGRDSSGTRVLQITDDVPFPGNLLFSLLCTTDNKHDLRLHLTSKIVPIHSDVVNTHLLLCASHDNSVISFPPTVNDTLFRNSSTAEEADQKVIQHALHCIKVGYSFIEI